MVFLESRELQLIYLAVTDYLNAHAITLTDQALDDGERILRAIEKELDLRG